jgi:hypothetical protein
MDDQEEPTCGRGMAASAVVPSALAAVAAGIAQNLDVHIRALDVGDPAAAREKDVYARVVHHLRRAAVDLHAAAEEMAAAVDLPMGAHDMAAMTTPDVLDAFAGLVAAEDGLRRLLEERRADNEEMLAMIRGEAADESDGAAAAT